MSTFTNVREFCIMAGQPVPTSPVIPDDETVRLRLRLIAEEFFETLESALALRKVDAESARGVVMALIGGERVQVDMPEFVDGLADLIYVAEGAGVMFGVDMDPIHAEVHRANMAKAAGPRREDGKLLKPAGWKGPDIEGELERQGWKS